MKECPRCGAELWGLGTFCWTCHNPVEPLHATPDATPRAVDLIPDDRLEDEIQEAGRKDLELLGFTVYSFSQDRATRQTPGIADTFVAGHGSTTWAEWKRPGKKQSKAQLLFQKVVTENGDAYHVWYHEADAVAWAKSVLEAVG